MTNTLPVQLLTFEEYLEELKKEREQLIGTGFDHWYAHEYHRLAD
jgi:hypothetical protein